jgi:hypothetical protein
MGKAKPFDIPKREVWEAFKHVKANQGAAGVDGQSITDFEADLSNNLYKLWNRLSSGGYFPPPVRRVDILKANGGTRLLGIATRPSNCPVRHLKFAAEGILIAQAREVRVEVDKLLVLAFDAARGLREKFGEATNSVFRADDPNAHNVA